MEMTPQEVRATGFRVVKKGYDPKMGARPLARVIHNEVKKPLTNELLFGKLAKGGIVRVKVENGKLAFDFPLPPATRPEPKVPALAE